MGVFYMLEKENMDEFTRELMESNNVRSAEDLNNILKEMMKKGVEALLDDELKQN